MQTATQTPAAQTALNFDQPGTDSHASTWSRLYSIVGTYLTHYKEDLTKHDRAALQSYKGPFLYGYRSTGTILLKLHPNLADYCKPGTTITSEEEQEIKGLIVYISGPLCNKKFLHYNGKKFIKITEKQAREIYAVHIEALISKARRQAEREKDNSDHIYYNTQTGATVSIF